MNLPTPFRFIDCRRLGRAALLAGALYGLLLGNPATLRAVLAHEASQKCEAEEESRPKGGSEAQDSASPRSQEVRRPGRLTHFSKRLPHVRTGCGTCARTLCRWSAPHRPDLDARNGLGAPLTC